MARYFFDSRDGDHFIRDDEGVELEAAKDALPKATRRELSVAVRDEAGRQPIRASLLFEVEVTT